MNGHSPGTSDSATVSQEWKFASRMGRALTHEINNHLAPIRLYLSVLRPKLSIEDAEILDLLDFSIRRSSKLVQQLEQTLDDTSTNCKEECDLRPILIAVERSLRESAPEVGFTTSLPGEMLTVKGDPIALLSAFICLGRLCCSAMANEKTPVELAAEFTAAPRDGTPSPNKAPWILVRMTHRGTSIGPGEIEHIHALPGSGVDTGKRLNLDLMTLVRTVRDHQGIIEVDHQEGPRTSIRVYLPGYSAPAASQAPTTVVRVQERELVLVVDDELAVRQVTKALLELHKFRVLLASNGREGLATFHAYRGQIGVVITDISMPEMNGVELSRALRRVDPRIPIIVMTADAEGRDFVLEAEDKASHVLRKPFRGDALLAALGRVPMGL